MPVMFVIISGKIVDSSLASCNRCISASMHVNSAPTNNTEACRSGIYSTMLLANKHRITVAKKPILFCNGLSVTTHYFIFSR